MAIFKTGPIIGAISGNLGGASFVTSSKSNIVRQPRRITHNRSSRTLIQRTLFQGRARRWATFLQTTRTSWITAAQNYTYTDRLGTERNYTGFQLWMRFADDGIFDPVSGNILPPVLVQGSPLEFLTLDFTLGGPYTFSAQSLTATPYNGIVVDAARTWRTTPTTFFRFRLHITTIGPIAGIHDVQSSFDPALGAPQLGETVALRISARAFGRIASTTVQQSTNVHA